MQVPPCFLSSRLASALFCLLLATSQAALAQVGPPTSSALSVAFHCQPPADEAVLIVSATVSPTMSSQVVGFDLFCREQDDCQPTPQRLNDEVLARGLPGFYEYTLNHVASFQGKLYRYWAVPVDAARQPVPDEGVDPGGWDPRGAVTYGTCSDPAPPIAVGTLEALFAGAARVVPCPGSCELEGYLDLFGALCADAVGTGRTVTVYGTYAGVSIEGPHWLTTLCLPSSCTVPTTDASWGAMKARFE